MIKAKLLALLLPTCLIIGGCATQTNSAPTTDADTTSQTQQDSSTETAETPSEPTKTYQVTDPSQLGLPAPAVEALKKAALPPPTDEPNIEKATVIFTTNKGNITVELNGKEAPLHVKSFVYLTKKGFYDGTIFHRYADLLEGSGMGQGRIIQGGDPLSKDEKQKDYWGAGGPGYEVPREHNNLKHEAFVLAAARSQDPDSAGSQFYFTVDPVSFLDDGDGYTVFGKVTAGKDVVEKLEQGDKLTKIEVQSEEDAGENTAAE